MMNDQEKLPEPEFEDPELQTAVDQGVMSYFEAEAAKNGAWPKKRPVLSVSADGATDMDPLYYWRYHPPTDEEAAAHEEVMEGPGHTAARRIAIELKRSALEQQLTEQGMDPRIIAARLRQFDEERPPQEPQDQQ